MDRDFRELETSELKEKYGHLRPGTFEITRPNYESAWDRYFPVDSKRLIFKQNAKLADNLIELLNEYNFNEITGISSENFINFAKKSILWREKAKFEFTRNISNALEEIVLLGSEWQLTREDISFLSLRDIVEF